MAFSQTMDEIAEDLTARSRRALAERRASGEIMTYVRDGWVYREFPGIRVERLCLLEDFKAADYPIPAMAECQG
jgi:hypothetical protein